MVQQAECLSPDEVRESPPHEEMISPGLLSCLEPLEQKAWIPLGTEQGPLGGEGFPPKLGHSLTGG